MASPQPDEEAPVTVKCRGRARTRRVAGHDNCCLPHRELKRTASSCASPPKSRWRRPGTLQGLRLFWWEHGKSCTCKRRRSALPLLHPVPYSLFPVPSPSALEQCPRSRSSICRPYAQVLRTIVSEYPTIQGASAFDLRRRGPRGPLQRLLVGRRFSQQLRRMDHIDGRKGRFQTES